MFYLVNNGEKITDASTLESAKNALSTVEAYYEGDISIIDTTSKKEVYCTNPGTWWQFRAA